MSIEKYGQAIQKSLFSQTNQGSTFSHISQNSKMFNITSKYFNFLNNKPPASQVSCAYNKGIFIQVIPVCIKVLWYNGNGDMVNVEKQQVDETTNFFKEIFEKDNQGTIFTAWRSSSQKKRLVKHPRNWRMVKPQHRQQECRIYQTRSRNNSANNCRYIEEKGCNQ